jgi:hypothetical protein
MGGGQKTSATPLALKVNLSIALVRGFERNLRDS